MVYIIIYLCIQDPGILCKFRINHIEHCQYILTESYFIIINY